MNKPRFQIPGGYQPTGQDMLGVQRAMAWERAKGELNSILATYTGDTARFERMSEFVETFVAEVEDEGLPE